MENLFPALLSNTNSEAAVLWSMALSSATLPEHRYCNHGQRGPCSAEIQTFAHIHTQQSTTSGMTLASGAV